MLIEVNKLLSVVNKMTNNEEIKQNWEKISSQLKEVARFLKENKLDEALYFTWLAAENIINNLKVAMNGFYLKDHKTKTSVLRAYSVTGILKQDYSKTCQKPPIVTNVPRFVQVQTIIDRWHVATIYSIRWFLSTQIFHNINLWLALLTTYLGEVEYLVFEKLSKYRLVAEFHPYTSIPKDYTKEDVLNFLKNVEELKKEVETILINKNILK